MKFGLLYELEPGPEPWSEDREFQVYHEAAGQAVYAEKLGWDYVWAVEHHGLTGYSSSSSPEAWLAFVAAQTTRVRLGHGVVQTARGVNNLVRIAERAAALDVLSKGRLEFGTGRGFTHAELKVFGVSPDDTRPMQEHAMRHLPHIWANGVVELDDEFYTVPRTRIHPKTVQRPHPPMWLAATQPSTWGLAGQLGAGVLAFGFANPGQLEEAIAEYRTQIANCQSPYGVVTNQILFAPPTYCAEDETEALEVSGEHVMFFVQKNLEFVNQWAAQDFKDYSYYSHVGEDILKIPPLREEEKQGLSSTAQLIKAGRKAGLFCVGTPDQCREFVGSYESAGINQLAFICQLGGLTDDQVRDSMRLLGEKVIPEYSDTQRNSP
jgi:alkanesulfonate monooxygenase SsuD/methylene tetrahydromethanopterin reductase-like flavin-dependent oxidoreductase (luciferase family)